MKFLKWLFGAKEKISRMTIEHSSKGEFNLNGRFVSGGHSQKNINELQRLGINYNIVKTYVNGVRIGNVPYHKSPKKRNGINQSWFPKNWDDVKIKRAGQVVSRGKILKDGETKYGHYGKVNVGIIRTNGKISTIFPASVQLNKKGVELHERKKTKRTDR